MSKLIKSNTVRLNLQDVHPHTTPSSQNSIQHGSHQSPKPPLCSKSSKSPQGDTSFRLISPKLTLSRSNSNHSLSKKSEPQKKQILKTSNELYTENQNDAVIEDCSPEKTQAKNLVIIKQTLTNISKEISNFHILGINLKTLKNWQSQLLHQTRELISLKSNSNTKTETNEISPRQSKNQEVKLIQEELDLKLQIEKRKRLEAEELSSKILQEQESQITLLNEKLFKLEQLYSKRIKD